MSKRFQLRWSMLVLLVFALTVLAGCGGGEPAAATATTAPATATTAPATATTAPATATTEAEPEGGETETEAEPTAETSTEGETEGETSTEAPGEAKDIFAVSDIDSYRIRMTMIAAGDAFTEQLSVPLEMTGEFVREPKSQRITIGGEGQSLEFIQIEDKAWANFGGQWTPMPAEESPDFASEMTPFNIDDLQTQLGELEEVGRDTINGYDVTHYHFNKETLTALVKDPEDQKGIEALDVADGDFYVADEGFIIKWEMHLEGQGINNDQPEANGSIDMTYEVLDINSDIEIAAPPEPKVSDELGFDFPLPEGAELSAVIEGFASYNAAGTAVTDTAKFFQDTLPGLGFEADDTFTNVSEESALLSFKGNGLDVTITVSAREDGGSDITISTTKQDPE